MESTRIPKASPDALMELESFLKPFAGLFRREESRQSLERYVTGLLTDLGRKNCDTIAAAVAGTSCTDVAATGHDSLPHRHGSNQVLPATAQLTK